MIHLHHIRNRGKKLPPLRVGIGGPVGSGKTTLLQMLCKAMRERCDLVATTGTTARGGFRNRLLSTLIHSCKSKKQLPTLGQYSIGANKCDLFGVETVIKKHGQAMTALLVGLVALVVALALGEFVSSPSIGHKLDVSMMPSEGRAILSETPGVPLSKEQWARLDEIVARHGGWPSGPRMVFQSVQASWYWLVVIPVVALVILRGRWKTMELVEIFLIACPSVFLLVVVLLYGHL